MKDEFSNRKGMFQTALGTLNSPARKPVWHNQPPTIFTTKVAAAEQAVSDLNAFIMAHAADITGSTADKAREEKELEDAAHSFGEALVCWFRDQGDETSAARIERPISAWRRLRELELLTQARIVRDLGQSLVAGPDSAAAAGYDLTAATVLVLSNEIADYEAAVTAPQQAIAGRKALTAQYRTRFNDVEAMFVTLDKLILRFDKTPAGRDLIAAYQASRIIRDLGHGPSTGGNGGGGGSGSGSSGGGGSGTVPAAPAAPTLAIVGVGQVQATWTAVAGAQFYKVYMQVIGTDLDYVFIGNVIASPTTLTSLPPGETIRVRLIASNTAGDSEPSPFAEITMPTTP